MAEPVNLLEIIKQQTQVARERSVDLGFAEISTAQKSEAILSDMERTQTAIGANNVIVLTAQMQGQQLAQKQSQGAIDAAGGFDALYALINQTATVSQELAGGIKQLRAEKETRFVDDPLTWIKAQVDWDGTEEKVKGAAQELDIVNKAAQNLESRISQVGTIARANAQTITNASITAAADTVALEAQNQAAKFRLEGLKANLAAVDAIAKMEDRELKYFYDQANFGRQEQQFELALREEDRKRQEFRERMDILAEGRAEKLSQKATMERALHNLNLGLAAQGKQPISMEEFQDELKLNGGKLTPELEDIYKNGKIIANGGPALIATSPAKAGELMVRDPVVLANLPEQQKKVAELLLAARQILGDKALRTKEGLDDDKGGVKAQRIVNQTVQSMIGSQLRFVGNNPDNIFYIGDPASFIGSANNPGVAAFQNYTLTQKVFNPAIAANVSLSDPNVPFQLALTSVRKGEISTSQAAADFSNIYKRMSALHRAAVDFKKFGIALPENGTAYKVKLGGEVVDATDFIAVAQAMNRQLTRDMMNRRQIVSPTTPPQRF